MTPPPDNDAGHHDQRRLVALACELENRLEYDAQPHDLLVNNAAADLPAEQLDELRRAEQALAFLNRARRHMDVIEDLGREPVADESARMADDSTGHAAPTARPKKIT